MMWTIILFCNFKINGLPEIVGRFNSYSTWKKARAWPLKSLALGYPCAYQFSLNSALKEWEKALEKSRHHLTPHLHLDSTSFMVGTWEGLRCCQDHHGHQPSGVGVTFLSPLQSRLSIRVSIWSALKWHQNVNFPFSFTSTLKNQHKKGICGMVLACSTLNFTSGVASI